MFVNTLSQKTIEALDSDARALLRKSVTAAGTWFSFSSLDGRDPETLSRLIRSAAAYLDRDDSDDEDEDDGDCAFDPLDLDVFKSEGGDFIIDADLAVGGPTIRARYESRWDTLEITASWGNCTVQIHQAADELSYLKDQLSAFGEM
nr:MAG TPA: hypothetical protein [Caudoviricetes sp.]